MKVRHDCELNRRHPVVVLQCGRGWIGAKEGAQSIHCARCGVWAWLEALTAACYMQRDLAALVGAGRKFWSEVAQSVNDVRGGVKENAK